MKVENITGLRTISIAIWLNSRRAASPAVKELKRRNSLFQPGISVSEAISIRYSALLIRPKKVVRSRVERRANALSESSW